MKFLEGRLIVKWGSEEQVPDLILDSHFEGRYPKSFLETFEYEAGTNFFLGKHVLKIVTLAGEKAISRQGVDEVVFVNDVLMFDSPKRGARELHNELRKMFLQEVKRKKISRETLEDAAPGTFLTAVKHKNGLYVVQVFGEKRERTVSLVTYTNLPKIRMGTTIKLRAAYSGFTDGYTEDQLRLQKLIQDEVGA